MITRRARNSAEIRKPTKSANVNPLIRPPMRAAIILGIAIAARYMRLLMNTAGVKDMDHVDFRLGFGEELPVPDGWADVVISNGVVNLMPDKQEAFTEMARVLKPGGRIQIGDILVDRPVPENEKEKIELWTG